MYYVAGHLRSWILADIITVVLYEDHTGNTVPAILYREVHIYIWEYPPGSAYRGNETGRRMDRRKVTEVEIFSISNLKFYTTPTFISVRKEQIFY